MKSRPVCTALVLLFLLLGFERAAFAQYAGGTGGTVTTSGGYTIHTFTGSGTFTSSGNGVIELLVVAGGGGGGNGGGGAAGGGGAGGVVYKSGKLVLTQSYTVTVGAGGAGSTNYEVRGANGANSVFGTTTAIGGGGGGSHGGDAEGTGASGGSGGGSGGLGAGGGPLAAGSGTTDQGRNGGTGSNGGGYTSGGGGGGAGAVGANGSTNGGNGGAGLAYSISGTSTYYGGGGGGARDQAGGTYGSGGVGGGGNGEKRDSSACTAGTTNTGGGGGGHSTNTAGCSGGSGIVIIRYPTPASGGGGSPVTIYWKKDHIYAGPGGGEIAMVTPVPSDTTVPTAPSGLAATPTAGTVMLSWTGSSDSGSNLAGYKIYRQKGTGANLPVGTVGTSGSTCSGTSFPCFLDQPLEPSTAYTYTIVAFDAAQNHSSASGSVNPTTSAASTDGTPPSTPTNLTALLVGPTSVRLTWNRSIDTGGSGIKGYNVYRGTTLISGGTPITAATFTNTGLSSSTTYAYKVEAVDNNNNSVQTSAVNITTPAP